MRSVFTEQDKKILLQQGRIADVPGKTDDYPSQIAKNIPSEVVSFYTAVFALVTTNADDPTAASVGFIMFFLSLFGTLLYSWLRNSRDKVPNVGVKVGMATVAFVLWAYALWWPFTTYIPYNAFVGSFLIIAYLFMSPAVYDFITLVQEKSNPGIRTATDKANIVKKEAIDELEVWLEKMPPDQKKKVALYLGTREFTPEELLIEIADNKEYGEIIAQMIYNHRIELAKFEQEKISQVTTATRKNQGA